jgi:hypothetical protein
MTTVLIITVSLATVAVTLLVSSGANVAFEGTASWAVNLIKLLFMNFLKTFNDIYDG